MKSPRTPDNEEPAAERACDFRPVDKGFTEEMALAEAERCLNCKKPFCVEAAPSTSTSPALSSRSARRTSAAPSIPSARTPCFPPSAAASARRRTSARASASVARSPSPWPSASSSASWVTAPSSPPRPRWPPRTARRSPSSVPARPASPAPASSPATALTSPSSSLLHRRRRAGLRHPRVPSAQGGRQARD